MSRDGRWGYERLHPPLATEEPGERNSPVMGTRAEHLLFATTRALQYLDKQPIATTDFVNCIGSFLSDLTKHPENKDRYPSDLMIQGLRYAGDEDADALRNWIEGFH